uniref:Uncharacterized protein n=1 Tax=uncultured Bacteroidota bacterium TaxID=152509 RepID=H5SMC1_9BACT|nr:hypothetical protein HGMM_F50B04C33 [uncultured Bacteroidetes bacterium]
MVEGVLGVLSWERHRVFRVWRSGARGLALLPRSGGVNSVSTFSLVEEVLDRLERLELRRKATDLARLMELI